jgi:hypothetical protein
MLFDSSQTQMTAASVLGIALFLVGFAVGVSFALDIFSD